MPLIALLFVVVTIFATLFGGIFFLSWMLQQIVQAKKYRDIMSALEKAKPVHTAGNTRTWIVTYKMNGVKREMSVEADAEDEALREYIQKGGSPRGVEGIRRG